MRDWLGHLRRVRERADALRADLARLEEQGRAKREELLMLEQQIREALGILRGDDAAADVLQKPQSRHGFTDGRRERPIQEGSSVWWTAKVLFRVGQPLHIDRILERIEQDSGYRFKKNTVVSNLSRYVRYGDTFIRPEPNVFGLVDFSEDPVQRDRLRFEEEQEDG